MGKYRGKHQYLSAWSYFWLDILYSIPVIGFIFLLIHSFGANNENRLHYARSYFVKLLVVLIISAAGLLIFYLVNPAGFFAWWEAVATIVEAYFSSLVPGQM